ncbi:MAG: hypothetical protein A3I73_00070 [Omnitrophica bacterium RIFCSPLOWO2_02_FULL_45_16]|nr:MAG: hypothetical protein A3K16_02725 [Omnitrophica bacterium RIFCSPLOWO2_01_FULL_45_24]OGX00250.1 MAG: hypothetical protein A3I73_00070 [Omnitrophica bacterium RIFCSPLOWO2_02_FULL_45_16]
MRRLFLLVLLAGLVFGALTISVYAQQPDNAARKIVVFQEDFVNEADQSALVKEHGAEKIKHLRLINGMAVRLPPQAESALLREAEVLRIDDDLIIQASDRPDDSGKPDNNQGSKSLPAPQPAEVLPWGADRINADAVWPLASSTFNATASGIKVAIMDTGIYLKHPDLQSNIKGQVNTINPTKSANDDNGHGTHVAGTVAAIDNDIGVIGVGPDISLYAVKVLNRNGSGWLSDLIEGLDWCINNKIQVINMSLGASSDNQSFHDAIIRAYEAGIVEVAAAGNNGATNGLVDYPARYPETIAVSAVGKNTNGSLYFASFSSSGPQVDLAAPGVNINSTYNNGYYKSLSGTSMAAPHVSGVVALVIAIKGAIMMPDDMKAYLKSSGRTEYLPGLTSYQQGAGLVRADLAAQ